MMMMMRFDGSRCNTLDLRNLSIWKIQMMEFEMRD